MPPPLPALAQLPPTWPARPAQPPTTTTITSIITSIITNIIINIITTTTIKISITTQHQPPKIYQKKREESPMQHIISSGSNHPIIA
jgi:hypothetical protein